MKKSILVLLAATFSTAVFSVCYPNVGESKVLARTDNSMQTLTITPVVETWQKVETNHSSSSKQKIEKSGGSVGLNVYGAYCKAEYAKPNNGFEVGGNIFYNFAAKDGKSKLGLSAGFDYSQIDSIGKKVNFYDVNAGIIIYQYIGAGISINVNNKNPKFGVYGNIYLPISEHVMLSIDGKYMIPAGSNSSRWTIGGGIVFKIPTKI